MKKKGLKVLAFLIVLTIITGFLTYTPDISLDKLKSKYANEESEFIDINGLMVHHRVTGDGPPLLLIHGTASSLHTWDEWTEILKDSFTIYRMDLPAFGLTGPNKERDYSMANYVRFVQDYVAAMKLDSVYVAGNSLGGNISWEYALAEPEKVKKLVLVDASGYPFDLTKALAFRIAQNPLLKHILKWYTPKSFIYKNLEQVFGDDSKITEELVQRYYDLTLRPGNRQAFIDRANGEVKERAKEINKIKCPTLIQWGEKDIWINPDDANRFKQDIESANLIIYSGAGHVPMEEIPAETAIDVLKFLKTSE